jgi:hypothetical protein
MNRFERAPAHAKVMQKSASGRHENPLDIDDSLLAKAKAIAAQEHISLTRLIEEGFVLRLRQSARPPLGTRRRLPVYAGSGGLTAL